MMFVVGRLALAALLGFVASLALPPIDHLYLLPLSMSAWLELLYRSHSRWNAFLLGWSFGFGHFIYALHWVSNSVLVNAEQTGWLEYITVFGIPSILGFYHGANAAICQYFCGSRLKLWWMFCLNWVSFEVMRSYWPLPFPVQLLGSAAQAMLPLAQFASVVGVYGLSWLLLLASASPFTRSSRCIATMAFVVVAIYGWGGMRMLNSDDAKSQEITIRLVQSNFSSYHNGNRAHRHEQLWKMLQGSGSDQRKVEVIVWPEAALMLQSLHDPISTRVKRLLPDKSWLVSGCDLMDGDEQYNAIISVDPNGNLISHYKKQILVPFGEYVPLAGLIPLPEIAYTIGNMGRGRDHSLLQMGGIKAVPMVCYEAFFSPMINNFQLDQAAVLLNVSNDIWFSSGPQDIFGVKQLWQNLKLRAIEYGRPLLRSANIGISGVIDQYGRTNVITPNAIFPVQTMDVKIRTAVAPATAYMILLPYLPCILLLALTLSYWWLKNRPE